jgi:uncharacterized protein YfaS (alpha-2-macroglobulin family)
MQIARQFRQRGLTPMAAWVAAVVLAIAGFLAIGNLPGSGQDELGSDGVRFEVVDGAHRELDGSPALALSFSLPLDAKGEHDKFVQVLEMPAEATTVATPDAADEAGEDPAAMSGAAASSRVPADTVFTGGTPVAGAWVVGDNPRLLFFPHIKPQTHYVVRIQPGLLARNGSRLDAEVRWSIRTAAVAPAFYFASRGMVLPAAQNGGLPVTTVNVPEVDIQFLKVRPDQLAKFLEQVVARPARRTPATTPANAADDAEDDDADAEHDYRASRLKGAVNSWELDQVHKLTSSVFIGRFPHRTEGQPPQCDLHSGRDHRGAARAGRLRGGDVAAQPLPRRLPGDLLLCQRSWPASAALSQPRRRGLRQFADHWQAMSGVEVSWVDEQGKTLARVDTDRDGRATFAEQPRGARMVMARKGEQMSLIALREAALDLAEFDIAGLPYVPVRLFAYSGRNLYRPGERFEVSVIARDADGHPVAAQPIQATLRRPDGKAQWTANWPTRRRLHRLLPARHRVTPRCRHGLVESRTAR